MKNLTLEPVYVRRRGKPSKLDFFLHSLQAVISMSQIRCVEIFEKRCQNSQAVNTSEEVGSLLLREQNFCNSKGFGLYVGIGKRGNIKTEL